MARRREPAGYCFTRCFRKWPYVAVPESAGQEKPDGKFTPRPGLLAMPVNGINAPQRPDCVAGHVGLEVRRETGKE